MDSPSHWAHWLFPIFGLQWSKLLQFVSPLKPLWKNLVFLLRQGDYICINELSLLLSLLMFGCGPEGLSSWDKCVLSTLGPWLRCRRSWELWSIYWLALVLPAVTCTPAASHWCRQENGGTWQDDVQKDKSSKGLKVILEACSYKADDKLTIHWTLTIVYFKPFMKWLFVSSYYCNSVGVVTFKWR